MYLSPETSPFSLNDHSFFYKRMRWDWLTLLAPGIFFLDSSYRVMGVQHQNVVLMSSWIFTLIVCLRIWTGFRGKNPSHQTKKLYFISLTLLTLQNIMIAAAFLYSFTLFGLGDSTSAILLAIIIGLGTYILFCFQENRPLFIFQLLIFSSPMIVAPFLRSTSDSWALIVGTIVVGAYFLKTLNLNNKVLIGAKTKAKVLGELNKMNERGKDLHNLRLKYLSEMAGGVAHEINNPLTIISGGASRLRSMKAKETLKDDDFHHLTEKILTQTNRIAAIVNSLRQFGTPDKETGFREESLNMIVMNGLDLCVARFKNYGIDIKIQLQYQGILECHAHELGHALFNIFSNAFEELKESQSKNLYIGSRKVEDWVEISICDNGRGVEMSRLSRVFMPFYSTKSQNKGIGLGLSIAKGIVDGHNGEILYRREDDQSCFLIILPIKQKQDAELPDCFKQKVEDFKKMMIDELEVFAGVTSTEEY